MPQITTTIKDPWLKASLKGLAYEIGKTAQQEIKDSVELKTTLFIPGNVASSKNSKQWTGKFLVSSKTTQNYTKATSAFYSILKHEFKEMVKDQPKPYKIGFYFIRDSKRKFDFVNVAQLPFDLMVKNGWIEDDNADEVIPVFLGYHVDKLKAGLEITVI